MTASRSTTFLVICLLLAALGTSFLPAKKGPYRIAPAVKDEEGDWASLDVLQETLDGVSFQLRYLDPPAARAAVGRALGRDLDLLPGRVDERRPGYLVFVLQLDNGTDQNVIYNPGHTRLASEKGDMKIALDYSALYEVARRHGQAAPELHELDAIFFDRSITLEPGGSVRKLLAFDAPREDRFRKLEVQVLEVSVGSRAVDALFPFRKFYD